jgi:DNA repair protein RadC
MPEARKDCTRHRVFAEHDTLAMLLGAGMKHESVIQLAQWIN